VDPTGHIEEGQDADARGIIDDLSRYGVTVDIDWGWHNDVWQSGTWELDELSAVLEAVGDLAAEIGGKLKNGLSDWENFRHVVGSVTIERRRWYKDKDGRHWRRGETAGNTIYLYNGTFREGTIRSTPYGPFRDKTVRSPVDAKGTIVHELGHVWNNNKYESPSDNIDWATTGERAPTPLAEQGGPSEYWAELVMCRVYPSQIETAHIPLQVLGPKQQAYFFLTVHQSYTWSVSSALRSSEHK
jgi:hypothetical protein